MFCKNMAKHLVVLVFFIKTLLAQPQDYSVSYVIKKDLGIPHPALPTTEPFDEQFPVIKIKNEEEPISAIELSKPTLQYVPHQAGLFENGTHYCGGAIIHERFIATTAYCCLIANIKATRVTVGTTNGRDGQKVDVATFYIHGGYDYTTKDYDLCLIKLTKSLQWDTNIQPIKLPVRELPEFTPVLVTNFGETFNNNLLGHQQQLKQIQAFHTEKQICRRRLNTFITELMLCVGNLNNDKGVCGIHSGDPLVVSGILYGLASWNLKCDPLRMKQPSVFTSIQPLKGFILEIVRKHNYN